MKLPWTILSTIAALAALAVLRLWLVEGLLRRVTIDGPSMATALCGSHYEITCGDCGFPFRIDAEQPPSGGTAACPNCGFGENDLDKARLQPPECVLIDRWPLVWRAVQRGEVVAARELEKLDEYLVKRVAAVAPKHLAIEGGDLYDDSQLLHKSLDEFRAVRLLVHDNDYQPKKSADLPQRWRSASGESHWKAKGTGFQIQAMSPGEGRFDWLEYEHWPCTADSRLRGVAAVVCDNDSYNQGTGPRELNAMPDVWLSCHLRATGSGQIALAAKDGERRVEIVCEPGGKAVAHLDGHAFLEEPFDKGMLLREVEVEFGLCDQRVLLAIDGRIVVQGAYERGKESSGETLRPLAIGAGGLAVEVRRLRVWRDVYYLDPRALSRPWRAAVPLSRGEVALLGDNQPVSIDSRQWTVAGVSRSQILGTVYRPFWSPD